MAQTQWTFAPLDYISSVMDSIQHNKVKCFSLGGFYEGKIDFNTRSY